MAYPQPRSMNKELGVGMTDGKYKKRSPNRGGTIDQNTDLSRSDLLDTWFGTNTEQSVKVRPDNKIAVGLSDG